MCLRLLSAGHRVLVFNRTVARLAPYVEAGAEAAASLRHLDQASVIVTCLDTVAASEAVYLDDGGVLAIAAERTLLVEHSTITPALAVRIGEGALARGLDFVDAPVSGGPEGAEQGTLAIMAGGSAPAFARAADVMRVYGRTIVHMGDVGAGTEAKLVNQLLTFVHGAAAAEAIALAERLGLDLDALAEVLRAGFGQSRMFDRTLARVLAGRYEAGAALQLYDKDLGIAAAVGAQEGMPLPVMAAARAILRAALDEGLGERDITALRLRYPPDDPKRA